MKEQPVQLIPAVTPNDPNPLQQSSGGGGSNGPDPGYAADPALAMMWGMTGPPITGVVNGSSSSSSSSPAPEHGPINADLGSFVAAENAMLPVTAQLVDAYNQLRSLVLESETITGFYGETAQYMNAPAISMKLANEGWPQPCTINPDTNIQSMANQFDQAINPLMSRSLRQIGDSITQLGQVINAINITAQLYCSADRASFFPAPGSGVIPTSSA